MTRTRRRYDLVGSGSMVLDRILRTARILGPEQKAVLPADGTRPALEERVGGVTLNHLGWARILGLRTAIFGKQAEDRAGRVLREGMERLGIEHRIDLGGSASSFAQVIVDDAGERAIYMSRGATAELTPADLEAQFLDLIRAGTFFSSEISQLPLATVLRAFELARSDGVRTVLDLDVPRAEAVSTLGTQGELQAILERTDVLKASVAAMVGWLDPRDPEGALRALCECCPNASLVVLTLGKEGALFASRVPAGDLRVAHVASGGVDVRDTTGAGDAFLGGLIAGLIQGHTHDDAVRLANACGAACCEQLGAFPDGIDACRRRVEEHLARQSGAPLELAELEFRRLPDLELRTETHSFIEAIPAEIQRIASELDTAALLRATKLILDVERRGGRVHVTGIGKPAHAAGYIAALLSSTGTPAVVLDASETTHGSAGQLRSGDLVIAISNSGGTPELLAALQAACGVGARIIGVTADLESPLSQLSEVVLRARVAAEGGPLGLAPRASILAELFVLQALSVQLQAVRGFTREDYHRRHPGGVLGQKSKPGV